VARSEIGRRQQHGFTKAFIVTDPVLLETGTAEKVDQGSG